MALAQSLGLVIFGLITRTAADDDDDHEDAHDDGATCTWGEFDEMQPSSNLRQVLIGFGHRQASGAGRSANPLFQHPNL